MVSTKKRYLHDIILLMITGKHYFRPIVYLPFLDNFLSHPDDKFLKHNALLQSYRYTHSTGYKIYVDNDQNIKHFIIHIKKT